MVKTSENRWSVHHYSGACHRDDGINSIQSCCGVDTSSDIGVDRMLVYDGVMPQRVSTEASYGKEDVSFRSIAGA